MKNKPEENGQDQTAVSIEIGGKMVNFDSIEAMTQHMENASKRLAKKRPVEVRMLKYEFNAVETVDLSMKLAVGTQQIEAKKNAKKSVVKQFDSEITTLESQVASISEKITSGCEYRDIDCEIQYHIPAQGMKTVMRMDDKTKTIEKMSRDEWNLFNQDFAENEGKG